jgi:hypothetical protein
VRWRLELLRRSGAARRRSKPPVVVSGLPLRELRMLVSMAELISQKTATCIIDGVNLTKGFSKLASNIRCKLKCIHNRMNNT